MKNMFVKAMLAVAVATSATVFVSCGKDREGWTLKGTVAGADETMLYIEKPSGASWVILDSVSTDGNGTFEYVAEQPATAQDIYRVRLGDRHIFFPVEGTDVVTLTTKADAFDNGHALSGTHAAVGFARVDSIVNASIARAGADAAVNDSKMIIELSNMITTDTTGVVAYYVATRYIGSRPIFDFSSKLKVRILGAAANLYDMRRPDDPRAAELRAMYEAGYARYRKPGVAREVTAELTGRIPVDLVRKDVNGVDHDFNAMADRGGVTILNLTCFETATSPANILALSEVYDKYNQSGLDIYQVSFDPNEAVWRAAAAKLPWTSVYNRPSDSIDVLIKYNADPTSGSVSFILDRNGEVVARVTDPSKLESEVAKLF